MIVSSTTHTPHNCNFVVSDDAPVQFLVGGVKRWWVACHSSKLSTNPDGQVNLDHVEENKRDVAAILVGLFSSDMTQVLLELRSIPRTPSHLNIS